MAEVCKLNNLSYDPKYPLSQFPVFERENDAVGDMLICSN